ncbi:hypothetical protein AA0323_1887 [Asaia siamensis NRIC 0323]|nr:hypothetical protein AA0323_1887 [Asaia siamensis NRIC 0323]
MSADKKITLRRRNAEGIFQHLRALIVKQAGKILRRAMADQGVG